MPSQIYISRVCYRLAQRNSFHVPIREKSVSFHNLNLRLSPLEGWLCLALHSADLQDRSIFGFRQRIGNQVEVFSIHHLALIQTIPLYIPPFFTQTNNDHLSETRF